MGRKNYVFGRSNAGGARAASILNLLEIAKLNGVDPVAYLHDVLTKIADGRPIDKLDAPMPWLLAHAQEGLPFINTGSHSNVMVYDL